MINYNKYSDKTIRNKKAEEMDELESAHAHNLAQGEANKIINKFQGEPRFLAAIAMEIARHVDKH